MEPFSQVELQLAARNHGMPLEALRYSLTPAGLHYLLIHFDIPPVDPASFALTVDGLVANPLSLSLDDLRGRPSTEMEVTLECAGNGRALLPDPRPTSQPWLNEALGTAAWRGVPLADLLAEAQPRDTAIEVVFTALDEGVEGGERQHFARSLTLADAAGALLAYEMNGLPLFPQHGYPLRLIVPGWYGMASVKWLTRITLVDEPFTGYQQTQAYRFRRSDDDPGRPMTRIFPRALMLPPGVAGFPARERTVDAGLHRLIGRAWSGHAPIAEVEVSTDNAQTWAPAQLDPPSDHAYAWRLWTFDWDATPGEHVLACRARDEAGNEQPDEAEWNVGGYANNGIQRVPVPVV
jgi:DMSO/TMAO reductase YedYZ molybdopterin-dependent catalytic subunit